MVVHSPSARSPLRANKQSLRSAVSAAVEFLTFIREYSIFVTLVNLLATDFKSQNKISTRLHKNSVCINNKTRKMTRQEKCELFEAKGFKYDPETGEITGIRGKVITRKHTQGYIFLAIVLDGKNITLRAHQFAWWISYREVPDEDLVIDHIDRDPSNNRISNLKLKTQQENVINSDRVENCKGYYYSKQFGKWIPYVWVNKKQINLGYFSTEEEARQAYLDAFKSCYPERYEILKNKDLL